MKHLFTPYLIIRFFIGFLFLQLGFVQSTFAQLGAASMEHSLYVPPSPDASGLMRFANVPVNEYTGIPTVNVPIDNLPGRKISVSVGLNYHAAGNKVLDVSSSVGLGWSLSAGGVVTRVMRGLPDESPNGYQYMGRRVTSLLDSGYLHSAVNNQIDTEPDAFFFNFMGHSGKIVIDTLGNPQYLPDVGIRVIQHPIHNNPSLIGQAWILRDLNGFTYTFGPTANSQETTTARLYTDPVSKTMSYTSSWYLVSVVSPDGLETVNFSYTTGPDLQYTQFRNLLTYEEDVVEYKRRNWIFVVVDKHLEKSIISPSPVNVSTVVTVPQAKYLSSIRTESGMITFSYMPRADVIGGQMLSSVQVFSLFDLATPLKTYTLNHSYFVSTKPNSPTDPDSRRLRLDCISLQGRSSEVKQLFVFNYNLQTCFLPGILMNSIIGVITPLWIPGKDILQRKFSGMLQETALTAMSAG